MGTLDSREYDRLVDRGFKDYSKGHREMYLRPISHIIRERRGVPIFEAGFGIGYGLKQFLGAGIVRNYVGCEPQVDSFNYTVGEMARRPDDVEKLNLIHSPFSHDLAKTHAGGFEHAFCIEVIEHVPPEGHLGFLEDLKRVLAPGNGSTLWLSTPCIKRNAREGVRTTEEWEAMLRSLFGYVEVDRSQWTYLYRCRG